MQVFLHRRSVFQGLVAFLALTLPMASTALAEEPVRGGTLTMVVTPAPSVLTTAITTAGSEALVSPKIFDGLLTYDFDMTPRPQLAESWDVSSDGLRITFNLRNGVKWHDGKDFTAKDVAFSVMSVWKQYHARGRATFAHVTAVETPDDHTAVLVLDQPSPALMKALASMESQILPEHLYAGTDIMTNPHNVSPVGTGPFRFVSFARGDSLVLERNPDYWDEGKPYLDGIVFRFIPDAGTRVAALESGEAQILTMSQLPLTDVDRLRETGNFDVETRGFEFINTMHFMEFNLDDPILQDIRVRKAIAHAIDRDWITKNIWFGYGETATGPVHSALTSYYTSEGVARYPFDTEVAEKLLDEAGYPRNANGVRFQLALDPMPYGDEPVRSAEFIRQSLRKVGIDVSIRSQDFATFVKRVYTDRDFQLTSTSANGSSDPSIGVQRFYWSKNFQPGVAFSNASHYANAEVDKALEAAATQIDEAKRKEALADFQRLVMDELPTLPLTSVFRVTIAGNRVQNHTLGAVGAHGNFSSVYIASE